MYSVAIKIEALQGKQRSAALLHVVAGFFLVAKAIDYANSEGRVLVIAFVFLAAGILSAIYGMFRKRLDPGGAFNSLFRRAQAAAFFILAMHFMRIDPLISYIGLYLFALVCIILQQTEKKAFEEPLLIMNEEGVRITGHIIPWKALTELIVREDFITIFHKEKKYLQYQVMQDLSTLELAKMNAYCKEKIEEEKEIISNEENKEGEKA